MSDLLNNQTDLEVDKYYEANDMINAGFNPASVKNKKSVFNTETKTHDVLMPIPSGGYIKIDEESPTKVNRPGSILLDGVEYGPETPEYQRYYPVETTPDVMTEMPVMGMGGTQAEVDPMMVRGAQEYAAQRGKYTLDDIEAAGYSPEVIAAAGLGSPSPEIETIEPLSEAEISQLVAEGGSLLGDYDPSLRERGVQSVSMFALDQAVDSLRDELRQQMPEASEEQIQREIDAAIPGLRSEIDTLTNVLFGTGNPLGVGAADFLTAGLLDIQEGYRMFDQSRGEGGSLGGRAIGSLLMLAGIAEATGVGLGVGKLIKAGAKKLQPSLVRMGEEAQGRIDAEGATLFSNPVGPIVDRGLAAAGRLAEGEKPSVDELRRQANIARFGYDPNDPVANVQAPTETTPGIIAFHGSGADFDEFKLEKIGTGEGNQAFGYGLYFTEKEDIAKFYRDSVGAGNEVTYKGKVIQDLDQDFADENNIAHMAGQQETPEDMQRVVADEVRRTRNNLAGIEQSIKDFQENPDVYPLKFHGMEISMETAEKQRDFLRRRLDAALKVQDNIGQIETKPAGTMYEVSLHVSPDELIDYDKPFDEQSAFVQGAILKVLDEVNLDDAMNMGIDVFSPPYNGNEEMALQATKQAMLENFAVVRFLNDWSVLRGAENSGEELLEKHGVKGVKYKAQRGVGARNVPETGADNYVIFDDKLINIMKKYGIVGPVAVTAMKSEEQEET